MDLGNFSWISLLEFNSLFWNFERRFSNLEAVLYMTMTAAYSKSARARSQNNYYEVANKLYVLLEIPKTFICH